MTRQILQAPDLLWASAIPFTDSDFQVIAAFAHRNFGLNLTASKKDMVYSRLIKRLRHHGLQDFASYIALLTSGGANLEQGELLSALTTNVTQFFRENHHFDFLRQSLLPTMIEKAKSGRKVRIWSAGCSTGQEAYSIALTILGLFPEATKFDVKILASDIDSQIIKHAKAAIYPSESLTPIPAEYHRYVQTPGQVPKSFTFAPEVRNLISFAELNLIADWPFSGPFDAIFCRNVAIYFDAETQSRLWHRFTNLLQPEGHLFIGHSERMTGPAAEMTKNVGVTVYRKIQPAA